MYARECWTSAATACLNLLHTGAITSPHSAPHLTFAEHNHSIRLCPLSWHLLHDLSHIISWAASTACIHILSPSHSVLRDELLQEPLQLLKRTPRWSDRMLYSRFDCTLPRRFDMNLPNQYIKLLKKDTLLLDITVVNVIWSENYLKFSINLGLPFCGWMNFNFFLYNPHSKDSISFLTSEQRISMAFQTFQRHWNRSILAPTRPSFVRVPWRRCQNEVILRKLGLGVAPLHLGDFNDFRMSRKARTCRACLRTKWNIWVQIIQN